MHLCSCESVSLVYDINKEMNNGEVGFQVEPRSYSIAATAVVMRNLSYELTTVYVKYIISYISKTGSVLFIASEIKSITTKFPYFCLFTAPLICASVAAVSRI